MQALQTKSSFLRVQMPLGTMVQRGVILGAVIPFIVGTFVPIEIILAMGLVSDDNSVISKTYSD